MPPSHLRHEINPSELEEGDAQSDPLLGLPKLRPIDEPAKRRSPTIQRLLDALQDYRARLGVIAVIVFLLLIIFRAHRRILGSQCPGYRQAGDVRYAKTGLSVDLELNGRACNLYGRDLKQAVLEVSYETVTRLRVHVRDTTGGQAQIPPSILPRIDQAGVSPEDSLLSFEHTSSPFGFIVRRRSDGDVLFDTTDHPLIFEDTYLQISSKLPVDVNLYGMGEVQASSGFRRDAKNTTQAIFNVDRGIRPDTNLYGSHPVYLDHRLDANGTPATHAVFLANMHPMDFFLREGSIEYRTLGGTFDFVFFAGPAPQDAIKQYIEYIGMPQMQAMWTLGFHLCRWGYKDVDELREVTQKMRDAKIPQDTQWSDIDYMKDYEDFTLDPEHYRQDDLANFVEDLHTRGQHYVPIIDVGIPVGSTDTYVRGKELDVYLKDRKGDDFVGRVWPGRTVYPDFTSTNTQLWWTEAHANLSRQLDFDGIWNDMNEPSNFCDGPCTKKDGNDWKVKRQQPDSDGSKNKHNEEPAYAVHSGNGPYSTHTIAYWTKYANGRQDMQMHNTYGISETQATNMAMRKLRPSRRPFILSRSTFVGSGRSAAHWFGDNGAAWEQMYWSLQAVLQFQLYGVPLVGADICGFADDTTEELCNRWMQLGALIYPFARNHNNKGARLQEPYLWSSVAEASRTALNIRYKLLPLWYTLLHESSVSGTPVVRALWWEWPSDPSLFGVDRQVMIGSSLLVTPVLEQGATSVSGFLPGSEQGEIWRDWNTFERISPDSHGVATFAAPLGHTPMHLRGGQIILQHDRPGLTVRDSIRGPYSILISLAADGTAYGESYHDDGESLDPVSTRKSKYTVNPESGCLEMSTKGSWQVLSKLDRVTILGIKERPATVTINGKEVERRWVSHDKSIDWLEIVSLDTEINRALSLCWR